MLEPNQGVLDAHRPSALGLTRLNTRLSFPPGGAALYRSILQLVDLSEGSEFLVVPCGRGRGARFVAESTGAAGAGADPDAAMVAVAGDRAKRADLAHRLQFEAAPLHDLPYQDAVFDLTLAEIELGAGPDPEAAVHELARVTKPGGTVVLIQLIWLRALAEARERDLVEQLGVRPRMPMEWKRMLRAAGIVDLHVEDWSDSAASRSRPSVLGGLTELFTLRGKLRVLPRAWRRWGSEGVRAVLAHDSELQRLLEDGQSLGVTLMKGTRGTGRGVGGRDVRAE